MNKINHNEFGSLVPEILAIAYQAGEKILEIYETDFAVENKEDNSPLTAADMAAHRIIHARLTALTPAVPILSEESAHISFTERCNWHQYWLVDPLDGTREFIKRNGEFSVNISLIEGHQSVLGVIHIPVSGEAYSGSLNNGAYIHKKNSSIESIVVKKTVRDNIAVVGSRSHGNKKQEAFLEKLDHPKIHSIGSSLKFCLVAEGKADIYPRFGPTSEWDTGAAQAIVEAAGGIVVDMGFERLQYNTKESLLNPEFLVIADNQFDWKRYI